jgi:uncharacterized membrane protein YedE/YeeE
MFSRSRQASPYSNPHLCGVGLGLVLLGAYVVMGRGLGASGAFASTAAGVVNAVAPAATHANFYFTGYVDAEGGPWRDWLIFEIAGVAIGGATSAWLAGRWRATVERGPRISVRGRLLLAFTGGAAMGVGAVLARGCTSGQALTGGALLSVGSWTFVCAAFVAAYLVAPLVKRAWA